MGTGKTHKYFVGNLSMVGKLWFNNGLEILLELIQILYSIFENKNLVNLFQRLWVWAKPTNVFSFRKVLIAKQLAVW